MRQVIRIGLVVVLLQAALFGGYWLVEHRRDAAAVAELGIEPPQPLDEKMPSLTLYDREGKKQPFRTPTRPMLLHFWASWCGPCRVELPAIVQLPQRHAIDVMAIAVDDDWSSANEVLGEHANIDLRLIRAKEARRKLGIFTVPTTVLVDSSGRQVLRFDGARNWSDSSFLRSWIQEFE